MTAKQAQELAPTRSINTPSKRELLISSLNRANKAIQSLEASINFLMNTCDYEPEKDALVKLGKEQLYSLYGFAQSVNSKLVMTPNDFKKPS